MKAETTCTNCKTVFIADDVSDEGMNCPKCDYPADEDIFFLFEEDDYAKKTEED